MSVVSVIDVKERVNAVGNVMLTVSVIRRGEANRKLRVPCPALFTVVGLIKKLALNNCPVVMPGNLNPLHSSIRFPVLDCVFKENTPCG